MRRAPLSVTADRALNILRRTSIFRRVVQGVIQAEQLGVVLAVEADHRRVGATLAHLERAIVKAKLFGDDPEAPRELPVVRQGYAYAVLDRRLRGAFSASSFKDSTTLLPSSYRAKKSRGADRRHRNEAVRIGQATVGTLASPCSLSQPIV